MESASSSNFHTSAGMPTPWPSVYLLKESQ
jgi:hypothetical protein